MDAGPDSGARPALAGVILHPDGWWECGAGHVHGPELDPTDGCPESVPCLKRASAAWREVIAATAELKNCDWDDENLVAAAIAALLPMRAPRLVLAQLIWALEDASVWIDHPDFMARLHGVLFAEPEDEAMSLEVVGEVRAGTFPASEDSAAFMAEKVAQMRLSPDDSWG